jgi:predicted nucleic acid-binding protein
MMAAVGDTSVLIDIAKAGLIKALLRSSYSIDVPDLAWAEVENPQQRLFAPARKALLLNIRKFSSLEMDEITGIQMVHGVLSLADCSCVWLCLKNKSSLLTSDRALTKIARGIYRCEVHGIIWFVREMANRKTLTKADAINRLSLLLKINPWLPKEECSKVIADLKKRF